MMSRIAQNYNHAALLPRIIGERLVERLEDFHYFKPKMILDAGCGTGFCLPLLHRRYPSAHIIGLDLSYPFLIQSQIDSKEHRININYVQADMQVLPFKKHSFDLVCANLSFLWLSDLPQYLMQIKEWLKPGGLLLFTSLGIDSFKEIPRTASPCPWGFLDIHTLGDALASAKWRDAVVDVDRFLIHYKSIQAFEIELQSLGLDSLLFKDNLLKKKPNHLMKQGQDLSEKCSMTWEVIYAQAWNDQGSSYLNETGEVVIPVNQLFTARNQ